MDAEKFPITTPYGNVAGYGRNNGYHRGEDRAMPMDTPILVNGHEIGLSGNTGATTGPHLHIGRFVGGSDTAPSGRGFHFGHAVVTEVGQDATNGKYVRIQADGASWVYLHLSRQSVPVGQELVQAAATPAPTPASYTVIETYPEGKQIKLTKQPTYLWGMNYHFDYMKDHPVEMHDATEVWTVTNKVHHEDGYDYYRRDGQVDGFNVLDCIDYVPDPPPLPTPPVQAKPPETYTLLKPLSAFSDAPSARAHKGLGITLDAGMYFVFGTDGMTKNLSTSNVHDQNKWINIEDNIVDPDPIPVKVVVVAPPVEPVQTLDDAVAVANHLAAPEVWKPDYHYIVGPDEVVVYKSINEHPFPITDYVSGNVATYMPAKHTVRGLQYFMGPDNLRYIRSEAMVDQGLDYGIPYALLKEAIFDTEKTRAERLVTKTGNFVDKVYYAWVRNEKHTKRFVDGIKQVIAGINQKGKK